MPISLRQPLTALVLTCASSSVFAAGQQADFLDLGLAKPYAVIQLGDNGLPGTDKPDILEISSNSSVFGSVLKGVSDPGKGSSDSVNSLKVTGSRITGNLVIENGAGTDVSSSAVGSTQTLTKAEFDAIAKDAVDAANYWAVQVATATESINLNDTSKVINGSTGGANIINVNGDFELNNSTLILNGGVGDFFVINVDAGDLFKVNNSTIRLTGDLTPMEVLFNVQGSKDNGGEGDSITQGSLFRGTLLAPGRNVDYSNNEFTTHQDGNPPGTTETDWDTETGGGIFGQIVAGGFVKFSDTDIAYEPFMAVPEPATFALLAGLIGLGAALRRRKRAD